MAQQNRTVLKTYFETGDVPTEAQFIDLIDSTHNIAVDGTPLTDAGAFATAAQGALADTATQPGDLATVATSGAYNDLSGKPTLGTAAATEATDYATAAQGALADTALQSADIGTSVQAHSAVLDATTASFLTADESKLDGIEAGAEVNTIESVTAGEPSGSDVVLNVVSLTQAEYDAGTPVATTFYIITA